VWLLLLGCAPLPPCGEPAPTTVSPGPGGGGNVLFIVLDDIGTEQIGAFELHQPQALTPTIDCLCERGMRFTRTWAAPSCSPARAALLTGRLADRTGLGWNVEEAGALPQGEVTLGELAKEAGYATGFVGKWHLDGWRSPHGWNSAVKQGFDTFVGTMGNIQEFANPEPRTGSLAQYDSYWRIVDGELDWTTRYATTVEVDDALDFIRSESQPWLLVLSLHASHLPAHEPPRGLLYTPLPAEPTDQQQFRAGIEAADRELSRLFAEMDPQVLADTNVFLLSDNGTAPFGVELPPRWPGVKGTLHEGGIRVPLLVTGPQVAHPGSHSDSLVHLVDLFPTVAEMLGLETEGRDLHGISLLERLQDPSAPGPAYVDTLWGKRGIPYERAIRDERYKLVLEGEEVSLFDLSLDPDERLDLTEIPLQDPDIEALVRLGTLLGTPGGAPRF
jgi:arylsulfatase B